ncbi:pyridoxal phosphate-dependent aminotransferase [Pseudomonas orientalis]|uniref:Aspartate/methionine/tyrosine aminotransferase n=1 Tax=Pseudomonas orientalis TaxID=76758 RepID=A0A1H2HD17_9PSED|nr:pyridoxal phosphate-dependent aminotransferase [Pseudomonas orientalis]KRP59931.1 aspartate/tyrosine/aromatic aminotransferase [Pseudomonas orientalis]SDU29682.1 Aspartate/methionine/tyrosine aminotransferase [Pseudomonas orientalis]
MLTTLTDHEYLALNSTCSFADGHAYHELPGGLEGVVNKLPTIWHDCNQTKVRDMEQSFKREWANLLDSSELLRHKHFRVSPTASNSIDIVATLLAERAPRVLLIEPTFDNLYLMLKRRGCEVSPLNEQLMIEAIDQNRLAELLDSYSFDTLFLVNPNNPTGYLIREQQFIVVAEYCQRYNKVLVVDSTFRFYAKAPFNDYAALLKAGGSFVVIEDTGKTWPTQDMKSSMIVYSEDLAEGLEKFYEEIYLCHSRFVMGVFVDLFRRTAEVGLEQALMQEIGLRRGKVRDLLANTNFRCITDNSATVMPVEWIDVSGSGKTDAELIKQFMSHGFHCLPGSHFFWHAYYERGVHSSRFIRISLARPSAVFEKGLVLLREICEETNLARVTVSVE